MKENDAATVRKFVTKLHNLFRETAASLPGMPDVEITVRENRVLSLICMLTEDKPSGVTLKELAAVMKLAPATVSELVERLVQKDLLIRVQNPDDRRAIQITPTEHTQKLIDDSLKSIDDLCGNLLTDLSPAEKKAMLAGLSKMADSLQES